MTTTTRNTKSVAIAIDKKRDVITDIRFADTAATRKFRNVRVDVDWNDNKMRTSYAVGLAYWVGDKEDRHEVLIAYGTRYVVKGLLMAVRRCEDGDTIAAIRKEVERLNKADEVPATPFAA